MRLLNSLFHVERIRFICSRKPLMRCIHLVIAGIRLALIASVFVGNLLDQMLFLLRAVFNCSEI